MLFAFDGGSNIIAALRYANIVRYECMAHSLHRFLVHDVLQNEQFKDIKDIVIKLKATYKKLSYSTEELIAIQKTYLQSEIVDILINCNEIAESIELEEEFGITIPNELEHLNNETPTTLKNANDTRWNTLLWMFKSFSKN